MNIDFEKMYDSMNVPKAPPRTHPSFHPEWMRDTKNPGLADLDFACNGLEKKSAAYKIMQAAALGQTAMLKDLLADPATLPDFANARGLSPLMIAAGLGHADTLQFLAQHPLTNVNRLSSEGWTALHYAVALEQANSVTILLQRQADTTVKSPHGETAFDLTTGKPDIVNAFLSNPRYARQHRRKHGPIEKSSGPLKRAPSLKDAFAQAATGISAAMINAKDPDALQRRLAMDMDRMDLKTFTEIYTELKNLPGTKRLTHEALYLSAAGKGNLPVLEFLRGEFHGKNAARATLDKAAFVATLNGGDHGHVVEFFLKQGVDVRAAEDFKGVYAPAYIAAYRLNRPNSFGMMSLYTDALTKEKEIEMLLLDHGDKALYDSERQTPEATQRRGRMSDVLYLEKAKHACRGVDADTLHKNLRRAVSQSDRTVIIALLLESRHRRTLRRPVQLSPDIAAKAIFEIKDHPHLMTILQLTKAGEAPARRPASNSTGPK